MKLTWYGTASLILQEKDTALAFDPFCQMPLAHSHTRRELVKAFRQVPLVFITHGHFDHIHHLPRLYFNRQVRIFCTRTPGRTLRKKGMSENQLREIYPGWQGSFGPFQITAYQGRHCRFDLPLMKSTVFSTRFWKHPRRLLKLLSLNLQYREKGEILFYEVSFQGLRIQIMGSMNLDTKTDYPVNADLLILPLQGRSDLSTYALTFLDRLRPKAVLLDHYDDAFPPLSDSIDPSDFIRNAWERFSIPCIAPKAGQTFCLEPGQIS